MHSDAIGPAPLRPSGSRCTHDGITCMLPICVGLMAVGIALAGSLCSSWGGRLETRLLLALIERLPHDD